MKLLWIPCWYDFAGGEAYNVILEKENGDFNKNKVSMEFDFDAYTQYVISVENGVLSIRKECWNDYGPNDYIDLVDDGVAAKDDLNEIITQGQNSYTSSLAKKEWLHSSAYEVEIKGWEW